MTALLTLMLLILKLTRETFALSGPTTLIAGRRCYFTAPSSADNGDSSLPLILLGGTAQTTASWMSQVSALSKDRPVLVYEAAGQGLQPFDSSNLTLPRQAELLHQTLQEIFPDSQFNIAGFSLGGRIAMAFAVLYPNLVNKLVVTGVSVEPSLAGIVALESWKHLLSSNNIDGFAWSILQTTYSPNFLRKNLHRLPQWVNMICENNSAEGLLELLSQTRALPEWSISTMSERLTMLDKCLILGELDIMAPLPLEDWNTVHIVPDCGHAVPTEQPLEWRRLVLDFLAKD